LSVVVNTDASLHLARSSRTADISNVAPFLKSQFVILKNLALFW
jgi:hypothetical protein